MSIALYKQVTFGPAYTGLAGTVGYALYNADGTANTGRTTTGITERGTGTGIYGADVTFATDFDGEIRWDTGGSTPVYASEGINPEDLEETTTSTGTVVGVVTPANATSLQTLVERIANSERRLTQVTATGGTTTTIISTSGLWQDDDYWLGVWAYVKSSGSSGPVGAERQVSAYNKAAARLTVPLAFATAPVSGDVVQLFSTWSRTDIVNAINEAVRHVKAFFWQSIVDETLLTTASTYSYSLGSLTFPVERKQSLSKVSLQINTNMSTYPYQVLRNWKVRWNGVTPTLQFQDQLPIGRKLRLEYMASAAEMSAATDTTGVDATTGIDEFITEWARYFLWQGLFGRAPAAEKQAIQANMQTHRDEAERIRKFFRLRPQPNTFVPAVSSRGRERDTGAYMAGFNVPGA